MDKQPLDEKEKEVHDLLMQANDKFMSLEKQHPDESREWCDAIHQMQSLLGFRTLRRDYPNFYKNFNV